MRPIEFPEQTVVWAKNQPEYQPLPAYTDRRETITLWRLTWRERFWLLVIGQLWLRQCNFGQPLQPQLAQVENPFSAADASKERKDHD